MADDYSQIIYIDPDTAPRSAATGTARAMLANRVSWYFNFLGPSLHIDTACSGSMVALDLACSSLRNGDSTMVRNTPSYLKNGSDSSIGIGCRLKPHAVTCLFDDALADELSVTRQLMLQL
jgi:acyl transferase domain-containing protein